MVKKMLLLPPPPPLENQNTLKQPRSQKNSSAAEAPNSERKGLTKQSILQHPRPRRTNPLVWFGAILCLIFSLILIFFGIATLIVYLAIKPRSPVFDIPNANLNTIYFDSPEYFNGDLTFLANFSNPNQKIDVRFQYAYIKPYFSSSLFERLKSLSSYQSAKVRLESVHIISSLMYLPHSLATKLQEKVQNNKVIYNIRGTFKVTATLGLFHYSFWLHGRRETQMTGPPTGVLAARRCKTER